MRIRVAVAGLAALLAGAAASRLPAPLQPAVVPVHVVQAQS